MIDIAELHIAWLAPYVRKTRDVAPLISHLNTGGAVTDDLRALLADFLTGAVKPSRKQKTRASVALPGLLKREVNFWADEFDSMLTFPKRANVPSRPLMKVGMIWKRS